MAKSFFEVMQQIMDKAAVKKELTETEKDKIMRLNEETVRSRYMTSREWEVQA